MKVRADRRDRNGRHRRLDAGLDDALAQTFPASDPFSVGQFTATEAPSRPADREAPRFETKAARPAPPDPPT